MSSQYIKAIELALNDEWDASHMIVQDHADIIACWIHAVLHKIEGDANNSRYWYAKTHQHYEDFSDAKIELNKIKQSLQTGQQ